MHAFMYEYLMMILMAKTIVKLPATINTSFLLKKRNFTTLFHVADN